MPYIVIDENGEIREEFTGKRIVGLNEGDRVVRKSSVEYLKEREEKKVKYALKTASKYVNCLSDTFAKVNIEELKLLIEALDGDECHMLFAVLPYVGYVDCKIKNGNGRPLDAKDFANLTHMSLSKAYQTFNSLRDKYLMCKIGKEYFVNPWLFYRGNKIDKKLKDIFGEYEIRCRDMIKWQDLE